MPSSLRGFYKASMLAVMKAELQVLALCMYEAWLGWLALTEPGALFSLNFGEGQTDSTG